MQSDSAKLIGEMIGHERAVSILPADIAEELVRIAGVTIVPYSLDWTMPPISRMREGPSRNVEALLGGAARETHGLR